MKLILQLSLLASISLFIGCGSTLKPVTLDPTTKRFPTATVLSPDAVKIKKPLDPKFTKLVYVKSDAKSSTDYHKFFKDSIQNMNKFETVADKEYFEMLIIQKKLGHKVSNVSDLVALHNLAEEVGPFLVVEPDATHKGGYNFEASLKAIDPTTGEILLHLQHAAFNWDGLDKPLFFPLLNGFLDWINGQSEMPKPATPPATPPNATLNTKMAPKQ